MHFSFPRLSGRHFNHEKEIFYTDQYKPHLKHIALDSTLKVSSILEFVWADCVHVLKADNISCLCTAESSNFVVRESPIPHLEVSDVTRHHLVRI